MALEEKYPDLCKEVDAVMKVKSCKNMQWNGEGFLGNNSKTELFKNKILKYMSENLAWIELYIREPYCELIVQDILCSWYHMIKTNIIQYAHLNKFQVYLYLKFGWNTGMLHWCKLYICN